MSQTHWLKLISVCSFFHSKVLFLLVILIIEYMHSNAVQALAGGTVSALKTWTAFTAMGI